MQGVVLRRCGATDAANRGRPRPLPQRTKRGGPAPKLSLEEAAGWFEDRDVTLEALDDALSTLAQLDPRQGRIVALRFVGGFTADETAVGWEQTA